MSSVIHVTDPPPLAKNGGKETIRSTVFIDKGKIKKIWSNVRVKDHAQEVYDFVKSFK